MNILKSMFKTLSCGKVPVKSSLHAFTLIELLSVVAMIAVLAGILFPALGSARERSGGTACADQLRQIAAAQNMYMGDFDEFLIIMGHFGDRYQDEEGQITIRDMQKAKFHKYGYLDGLIGSFHVCPSFHPYSYVRGNQGTTYAPVRGRSADRGNTPNFDFDLPEYIKEGLYWHIPEPGNPESWDPRRGTFISGPRVGDASGYWTYVELTRRFEDPPIQDSRIVIHHRATNQHLRHSNTMNMPFLDGRVEMVGIERAEELELRSVFTEDLELVEF